MIRNRIGNAKHGRRIAAAWLSSLLVLTLAGCGAISREDREVTLQEASEAAPGDAPVFQSETSTAPETEGPFFRVVGRPIPEPDLTDLVSAFAGAAPEEEEYLSLPYGEKAGDLMVGTVEQTVFGSRLCLLRTVAGAGLDPASAAAQGMEENLVKNFYQYLGGAVQTYDPEADQWETVTWEASDLVIENFDRGLKAAHILGIYEDRIYLQLMYYGAPGEERGFVSAVGGGKAPEVLGEIPPAYLGYRLYLDQGVLCGMDLVGKAAVTFDASMEPLEMKVFGPMEGWTVDDGGNALVYGIADKALWFSDSPAEEPLSRIGEPFIFAKGSGYAPYVDGDGMLVACNNGVYFTDADGTHLCRFADQDLVTTDISGIWRTGDGFCFYDFGDTGTELYTGTPVAENPALLKQTVTARVAVLTPYFKEMVTKYNSRSEDYRIVLQEQTGLDYMERLEKQLAAGEAPDLIETEMVDVPALAVKGAFLSLDDLAEEARDGVFASALACGQVDGTQYMLPYEIRLQTYVTSRRIAGDLETWNTEEFMERIEGSGAELALMAPPAYLAEYFALYDTACSDYIDWGAGESHLEEAPFVRVLEFAKKYGKVDGENFGREWEQGIYDGRIAGDVSNMPDSFTLMNRAEVYFQGQPSFLGFPRQQGSGGYIEAFGFVVNADSPNAEAAKDFLRWLISEEGQRQYLRSSHSMGGNLVGMSDTFCVLPVRPDQLQEEFELYQEKNAGGNITYNSQTGLLDVTVQSLTEEQGETYLRLIREARPVPSELDPICIIVEEEMGPFLAGQKSAEETARIIDSRVQLYLSESR